MKKLWIVLAVIVFAIGMIGCSESETLPPIPEPDYGFEKLPTAILQVPSLRNYGPAFSMVDWDLDGDKDALAVESNGKVFVYINEDEQYYKSQKPLLRVSAKYGYGSSISVMDWDGDGYLDILAADSAGHVHVYRNVNGGKENSDG